MKNGNCSNVIHKDVVIVGNGPSGLALSYMLAGNTPRLISTAHPDELISARLSMVSNASLVHQDLIELADGLEGRSRNPISVLYDALSHPYADVGFELNPLIEWHKDGVEIDHVVLGKGPPGGSWHEMDPNILTLSLGSWMALPGLPYRIRDGPEKRASAGNVANYYLQYIKEMQLQKYMKNNVRVTKIRQLKESPKALKNSDSGKVTKRTDSCDRTQSEVDTRRQRMCSLSNAFNFIGLRSNRSCKRRRDVLLRNGLSPDRKIREVFQRSTTVPANHNWPSIATSKDFEEVPQTIDLCYGPSVKSVNRSISISCDFDNFQSPPDSFCSKSFNEQDSFVNCLRSSCHFNFNCSTTKVPSSFNTCDKDPIRLKQNCDPSTSQRNDSGPKWLVEVCDETTGNCTTYTCNHLVLANGTSDLPNKLAVTDNGESPAWMVHDVRSLELGLDDYPEKNCADPVLVVGAGLSAADAIIATRCRNIPVLHLFRHKNSDLGKQLPENMYPEYHKVHQMMQDGGSTYPLYRALPEYSLTDMNIDKRTVTVTTKSGEELTFSVSFAAVLIGAHPDFNFLPEHFSLGVNKSSPIDNKTNNIDINKLNHAVNGFDDLYAMGPLAGDNFVRFIPGGALAIVSDLYKKFGY